MGERLVESLIGAVVLIVAGVFFFYAYTRSNVHTVAGYDLKARFGSVGSLTVGSDVRVSGIKVGTVTRETLDPETYLATVEMSVDPKVKVPDDSSVRIAQDGLLGGNYLIIEPGGSDSMLQPGGTIVHAQGAVDLLSLVGQAIFSAGKGGGQAGSPQGGAAPAPAGAADPLQMPGFGGPPATAPTDGAPANGAPANGTPAPAKPDAAATRSAEPEPSGGQQALPPQPQSAPAP